jgi:hypothetical protein
MIRAAVDGVLAVVLAVAVGLGLAFGLGYLGLTDTGLLSLGPWLAGLGLLGGWQQSVDSDVAGGIGWTTTVAGAPLLVTGVVVVFVGLRARRGPVWLALPGAAGTAAATAFLVFASRSSETVDNAAGSVTTSEGLTWFWTGHLGTVAGAAALVAGTWLLATVGRPWWLSGRAVALGLLFGAGVVLTIACALGAWYLTSSGTVAIALALMYPLVGTAALLAATGVPVEVGLTRLTPETLDVSTWTQGWLYGVGGLLAALLVAAATGGALRLGRHRSTWLGAGTVTGALAAFLAWAMGSTVEVPESLGAVSQVVVDPLLAAAAGAGLGLVTRWFAGPAAGSTPVPKPKRASEESEIEDLLSEVGQV